MKQIIDGATHQAITAITMTHQSSHRLTMDIDQVHAKFALTQHQQNT
jgi:hypothetical protein